MKRILTTLSQKWPEYLLEMIVITAGILGAFALNNWKQAQTENQLKSQMLVNLLDELDQNENRLLYLLNDSSVLRPMREISIRFDSLEKLLADGWQKEEAKYFFQTPLIRFNEFNLKTSVYQELVDEGIVMRVDSEISMAIQDYYLLANRESLYNSQTLVILETAIESIKYGYRALRRDYPTYGLEKALERHQWIYDNASPKYIDFITYVEEMNDNITRSSSRMERLVIATRALKERLSQYIEE